MAISKEDLIEEIKGMSVLDLADVVKALEEEFGVSAAAPVAVAAAPGAGGGAEEAADGAVESRASGCGDPGSADRLFARGGALVRVLAQGRGQRGAGRTRGPGLYADL